MNDALGKLRFLIIFGLFATVSLCHGESAVKYLGRVLDQYHTGYDVYSDADAAGNHFAVQARMSNYDDANRKRATYDERKIEAHLPGMCLVSQDAPHSGVNCIKAQFNSDEYPPNWGAWYFMNGIQGGSSDTQPELNWGASAKAGIDLRGATSLTFWARGEKGGERVEFIALGVGHGQVDPMTHRKFPHPDSADKVTTGFLTLSTEWTKHTIDLSKTNLSYVLGGFGWASSARENDFRNIVFYMDDIRIDKARPDEPRFLVSFAPIPSTPEHPNDELRNTAFCYDNAVALMAFLACNDKKRAQLIADAFLYSMDHDRSYPAGEGWLRNAYQGGDLASPPGWTVDGRAGTARVPGWLAVELNPPQWREDRYCVSTDTGNVAWVMLALLAYHHASSDAKYLRAVETLGKWVFDHCHDEKGHRGFTGRLEGWDPKPEKKGFKATEHNLDLYAAYQQLYLETKQDKWKTYADEAKAFVMDMWDDCEQRFLTGTDDDGVTRNKELTPVDIQAWALLALKDEAPAEPFRRSLVYAESHLKAKAGGGFAFSDKDLDGTWYEGTAQMAVACLYTGQRDKYQSLLKALKAAQLPSGAMPASSKDGLWTGFSLPKGKDEPERRWLYFKRAHVGATAWMVLAEKGINPFWMERLSP